MNDAGTERRLAGQVASPGLAVGELAVVASAPAGMRRVGSVAEETEALDAALADAGKALSALIARSDAMAGDILSFQLALLEDDELLAPIRARVAAREAADAAWQSVLDREVAHYAIGEDEYFHARGADLSDLRDRVLDALRATQTGIAVPRGPAILAAEDLTPSRFLETDWQRFVGAALMNGAASGHVAMLARARGVPLLIGLGEAFHGLRSGDAALLDAELGLLLVNPAEPTRASAARRTAEAERRRTEEALHLARPAATALGQRVQVTINVDDPRVLDRLDPAHTDGIGLARSEFLFRVDRPLPDEETQLAVYRRLLGWAKGRPVTVRTLDAGGDKPIPSLTPEGERNSFLGVRGLRLSLARPEVFAVQLRALARAAVLGPLKAMVPMVTRPEEFIEARRLFEAAVAAVQARGQPAALPPFGMMVEVPAAALTAEDFPADFYSIGSNDLVQYVTAASRDDARVASLYDPTNRAVLELIARVVEAGRRRSVEVSLCGDMASDPVLVPLLLERGLLTLSTAPGRLAAVKAAIARWQPAPEARRG